VRFYNHRLTIIKEFWEAKLGCGFAVVKSVDKNAHRLLSTTVVV